MAGVHRDTLLRWLREGKLPEPRRDEHGWRTFSGRDVQTVLRLASATQTPSRDAPGSAIKPDVSLDALSALDWDFHNAKTSYLTHAIHPYPAKYIPQIPNALIQELSSVGDVVADPFCGSGTTLVEALLLKRHAVGVDANPLACLISRAKTSLLDEAELAAVEETIVRANQLAVIVGTTEEGLLFRPEPLRSDAWRPDADALTFWFEPHVVEELAEIRSWCLALPGVRAQELALAAFSSIIVAVSKQDSDTRYVRREKGTRPGETLRRFAKALRDAASSARELADVIEPRFTVRVEQADVLDQPNIGDVDLVVCSPPYPNAYSYHLYHMTRMLWLQMDQPTFKSREIGSHRKYSSRGAQGATVETFRYEMQSVFAWLARHLKNGGYACFVIGDSTVRGERVDNASLLEQAAAESGFVAALRIPRSLQLTRKAFNPVIGSIKSECVLILRKKAQSRK